MARAETHKTSLPRMLGPFAARPRLAIAFGVGLVVAVAALVCGLSWSTSVIFGWDATCLVFAVAAMAMMWGADTKRMKAMAATQDEGQAVILGVVTLSAAASIGAVAVELAQGKAGDGLFAALRLALVFATVAGSWFMVHLIFALHYAHQYYGAAKGGLAFPGGEDPDYWDFLHFATVIGVASQTADVAFTSKSLRRTGTVHGIIAFVFNTVILALTINTAASLFN